MKRSATAEIGAPPVAPDLVPGAQRFGWQSDCRLRGLSFDDYDLVTLDVFDTLLFRIGDGPRSVFTAMAELAAAAGALVDGLSPEAFTSVRVAAEARARRGATGTTGEVTLEQIYDELPADIGVRDRLVQHEFVAEAEALFGNPFTIDLLHTLQRLGKRVWLVSDMYLGATRIGELLAQSGITADLYESLIVSSDHGASKANGGLFRNILASLPDIRPERILHIGDDPHSDHAMPRSLGISTCLYAAPARLREVLRRERIIGAAQRAALPSIRSLAAAAGPSPSANAFWHGFGATVIGPLVDAYAGWVLDDALARGCELIAPFLREGALLARFLQLHADARGVGIPVVPLHISRQALLLPSLAEFGEADLDRLSTQSVFRTLGDLFALLGISSLPPDLVEYREQRLVDLIGARDTAGHAVFDRVKRHLLSPAVLAQIRARASTARATAERYFDQVFGHARNIATVDLGARGTAQALLEALPGVGSQRRLSHYLFYGLPSLAAHRLAGLRFSVYLPETKAGYAIAQLLYRTPQFLELAINGNQDTTIGYRLGDTGRAEPVLSPGVRHSAQVAALDLCLGGIESYIALTERLGFRRRWSAPDRWDILAIAHRAVHLPTLEEAQLLGSLVYDYNDGTGYARTLCDDQANATLDTLGHVPSDMRLKMALQQRPDRLPWPQGAVTLREPDAIERMLDAASGDLSSSAICRYVLDQVCKAGIDRIVVCAAGGPGGMGPTFLRMAADRGVAAAAYLDYMPATVGPSFEGAPVILPEQLPTLGIDAIAVISTGYGKQIIADVDRAYAGTSRTPRLFTAP